MQVSQTRQLIRRSRGNLTIELSLIIPLMVVCAGVALNGVLPSYGAWWNDAACRDAARAAASQKTAETAKSAAKKALLAYGLQGGFITSPTLVESEFEYFKSTAEEVHDRVNASYAKVTTTTKAKFLGSDKELTFKRTYWYPLSNAANEAQGSGVTVASDEDGSEPDPVDGPDDVDDGIAN